MLAIILAISQGLVAISTILNFIMKVKTGGSVMSEKQTTIMSEKQTPMVSPIPTEDAVSFAISSALNALFTAWQMADQLTSGKIADWDVLASKNARLQAKIDAEKAQG